MGSKAKRQNIKRGKLLKDLIFFDKSEKISAG